MSLQKFDAIIKISYMLFSLEIPHFLYSISLYSATEKYKMSPSKQSLSRSYWTRSKKHQKKKKSNKITCEIGLVSDFCLNKAPDLWTVTWSKSHLFEFLSKLINFYKKMFAAYNECCPFQIKKNVNSTSSPTWCCLIKALTIIFSQSNQSDRTCK